MSICIAALILAGTASAASAEEVRRTLSVTATVTDSCAVSTGSPRAVSCTAGTRWQSSTQPLSTMAASQPLTQESASRGRVRYLTITY